jgi:1-acyl-sn-glycerol-3-phosphate acyltransferase
MTLDALIMGMGAFIVVLPFLGLPQGLDSILFFFAGIIVVALGILVRRRGLIPLPERPVVVAKGTQSFVESDPIALGEADENK